MLVMHLRFPDEVVVRIKKLARKHGISEAEAWRSVVLRGLVQEEWIGTHIAVETLCIARRLAAEENIEVLKNAKEDARVLLREIGNLESHK